MIDNHFQKKYALRDALRAPQDEKGVLIDTKDAVLYDEHSF